ncbi:MAG: NAD-binding protein, partial [Cyanobium sp.]
CWRQRPPMPPADSAAAPVLVCGLGAFGQAVAARLLPSGVPLRALALHPPDWRSPQLQQALAPLLCLGDMRKPHGLRQAGVEGARAVLLLSSDSGANLEAALQVRLINDNAVIVVRSAGDLDSLSSLLQQRLPRCVVVNPLQLSAGALLQALQPGPQLARFSVDGESFEVRQAALDDQRLQRPVRLEAAGGPCRSSRR